MFTRRAIAAVALVVSCLTATTAFAQEAGDAGVRRPFRGLFGAPAAPDSPHSLVLSGSLFAAYDDNVLAGLTNRSTSTPWLQRSGAYQGANVGLNYTFARSGERVDFQGHLGTRVNYYRRGSQSGVLPANQADVTFSGRITRSLTFSARQSASYTSNYNPSLTPRTGEEIGHDIGLADDDALDLFEQRALRLSTTVSLSQALGRYTSMSGAYHYRTVEIFEDEETANSPFRDYGSHAGSFNIRHSRPLTRNATLQLGYAIRVSDQRANTGEPRVMHNVNAGVNYSRALSFSRRTFFGFGTGSAIAVNDRVDIPDSDPRTRVRLTGNAALVHQMGRTWAAQIAYSRGFRTRDGFDGLYFTDAVRASLGGLVTRRLSFNAAAFWADSSIDGQGGGNHKGYSANAQAQYGLSRFAALYARYAYYHYSYSDTVQIDPRLPRQLDRHGVRVGLTASVPLIR